MPSLDETYESLRERKQMAWIDLYRPGQQRPGQCPAEFDLHELILDDAIETHQRPRTERYSATLFSVPRPAVVLREHNIDQIEDQLCKGDPALARRILSCFAQSWRSNGQCNRCRRSCIHWKAVPIERD